MSNKFNYCSDEHSACGVGFITSRKKKYTHSHLIEGLHALRCVEHRGACSADGITGDGAGIMTDIPFEMLGFEKDTVAVATLFLATDEDKQRSALNIFEKTLNFFGLEILDYRDVPVNHSILGKDAAANVPVIKHAIIKRPERSKTNFSFDKRLYNAKQLTRSKLSEALLIQSLHFASLSAQTIVYKALTKAEALDEFYPDLKNKKFTTRFCLFHRRFSTNTKTSWDKIQPFRLIGHNGEINTIAGNRSWAKSREKMIGAERNEILTRKNISDSGSLNEMVEALRYRSSIPNLEDILAIMMPPATEENEFYTFWSRAMEPWDGPAFITYANGYTIGARLDRNGFRPCRWVRTEDHFYLSSEAGTFHIEENKIEGKGTLFAGRGVTVDLSSGEVLFRDPSHSKENHDATFDARLKPIPELVGDIGTSYKKKLAVFSYTDEELAKVIYHMAKTGKEPVGSMGDTARLAVLSTEPRSFFDFFYQNFSQVTNPPLDYIREKIVTDLTVHLGKKPNIFEPKELIPAAPAYELKSPFLSLAQMEFLRSLITKRSPSDRVVPFEIDTTFKRSHGIVGFKSRLNAIGKEAIEAVKNGYTIIILSDRNSDYDSPGIPSLLGLRRVVNALNDEGLKLNASVVIDSGEVKSTHHASALIGFGAQAVCPFLALDIARNDEHRSLKDLDADIKERNLLKAFDTGLLKIMAKSGISVVRSYQSAKMYSALGLGPKV
ncbi:MAG TPA: glutamate synthase large subunit, partial [Balneola sp.]|nr:glutamate synthase large subunit [Balneola sp.]